MLSGYELFFSLLIVAAASTVIGTVGFGFSLVAVPVLLIYLEPQQVVVVANSLIALLMIMVLARTWENLKFKSSLGLVLGGMVATPIGVLALNSASPASLRITIAIVIIFLGLFSLKDVQLPFSRSKVAGPVFGFLTSLAVTTIALGGPLGAIYAISQRWKPDMIRAALALFFLASDLVAFPLYVAAGLVEKETLFNIGLLIPGLGVGFCLARVLIKRINESVFRYVVVAVIIVAGSVTMIRELGRF